MGSIANGFAQLFKAGRTRIGKAIDNYLVGGAEARKAISDEVKSKFQPMIDRARGYESKRAANITELGNKLTESKKAFQDAQADWNQKYADALANAKTQRQTDIADYETKLQGYQNAVASAKAGKRSIMNQLNQQEATYTPTKTIFTDVNTGDRYLIHPATGEYKNITQIFKNASRDQQRRIVQYMKDFDERLVDNSSGTPKVINAFNKTTFDTYHGNNNIFDAYIDRVGAPKRVDLINANNQIKQANSDLTTWQGSHTRPTDWDDTTPGNNDLTRFEANFKANNAQPTEYRFNGQTYGSEPELKKAYQDAVAHEQSMRKHFDTKASEAVSSRDAEIAKRIQDAKDVKKAKLALGAGALAAGAAAMYGGDDTDTGDTPDSIDNTADTYTGEPDPKINIENTPDGKAALDGRPLKIDTDFDPDKADAAAAKLASEAYDKGVEDGNSVRSSDIVTADGQHIDDELFELLKAMKDPYKADAIANYIYSRHGDDLDVRRRGWRAWLDRNYGDPLRSKMGIDPSGYKGMHVSGGL